MTYKEAAQTALDVQDACNLSGVVFTFAAVMKAICERANQLGAGTEWKNQHPIVVLFLDKLADLARCCDRGDGRRFSVAYDSVRAIAAAPVDLQCGKCAAVGTNMMGPPEHSPDCKEGYR
jgi:hypothetical protein